MNKTLRLGYGLVGVKFVDGVQVGKIKKKIARILLDDQRTGFIYIGIEGECCCVGRCQTSLSKNGIAYTSR